MLKKGLNTHTNTSIIEDRDKLFPNFFLFLIMFTSYSSVYNNRVLKVEGTKNVLYNF